MYAQTARKTPRHKQCTVYGSPGAPRASSAPFAAKIKCFRRYESALRNTVGFAGNPIRVTTSKRRGRRFNHGLERSLGPSSFLAGPDNIGCIVKVLFFIMWLVDFG